MGVRDNGRIGEIFSPWETLGDLLVRGIDEETAITVVAWGVFIRRTRDSVEPIKADADLMRGAIGCRAYLEQVAPEELER